MQAETETEDAMMLTLRLEERPCTKDHVGLLEFKRGKKMHSPQEPPERRQTCHCLALENCDLQRRKGTNVCCPQPPVGGHLLQQQEETNTASEASTCCLSHPLVPEKARNSFSLGQVTMTVDKS